MIAPHTLSMIAACTLGTASLAAPPVALENLLDEMTDLRRLAELPEPAYITRQASSYDRAAKSPSENWFANGDSGKFLRVEKRDGRDEHVMMDADGPGAIVRIWSANPAGTLRIYLDGSDTPAITAPLDKLLGGEVAGLPKPLAGVRARGWNLYFPIAYAKHCKVTSDKGGFYYHVNYRTYAPGTPVETFEPADLQRLSGKIENVAKLLADPAKIPASNEGAVTTALPKEIAPGEEKSITLEGPRAISRIQLKVGAVRDLPAAMRALVIEMGFDGEKTVATPLGDFFATAPGLNGFASVSLAVSVKPEPSCTSNWFMPFARQARITLRNLGTESVPLSGSVTSIAHDWTNRSLLFHAKWRIERDIPTRPIIDWPHLHCTGHGRFVGGTLHIVNPVRGWWGEGDEKIYIDGEDFPSTFGTGTEDYYGYAWGSNELYTHAYHNQPRCDGPGVYGHNLESRFHILDDMPFTKSFRFDMENWHSAEGVRVTRAAVSFWYARPGGTDFFEPIAKADVVLTEVPPFSAGRPGTIEGEHLVQRVVKNTGGEVGVQEIGEPFSGDRQLRWHAGKSGATLELTFDSKQAGGKQVLARFKQAPDFAVVQVYINGRKAGDPIDCYRPDATISGEIDLGRFDLKKGPNELTLEATGKNPAAKPKMVIGLDYIRIK